MNRGVFSIGMMVIVLISLTACSSKKSERLSGAGATFPEQYYKMAFKKFSLLTNYDVAYGAIGSGGGLRSLQDQTVDFAATDVFLSDKEMGRFPAAVVHVPTALGAVVLAYNLKGVSELNLNADVLAGLFLGQITNWNDKRIKTLNPGVNLPDKSVTVVYRSDGSGTTAVFSEYLSKVNPAWKATIGEGKSLKFPAGISAKGNTGVAGIVLATEGAIGYVGSEYATALHMATAGMQNSAGNFIKATSKTISEAANSDIPADTRITITNSANPGAYPISMFTWIVVYQEQYYNRRSHSRAKALEEMLAYLLSSEGQNIATQANYAPLSGIALEKANAVARSLTYQGNAIH